LSIEDEIENLTGILCESVRALKIMERLFISDLGISPCSSLYVNFRDSLFHFGKVTRAYNGAKNVSEKAAILPDLMRHKNSIEEHLERGLTDAGVYLLFVCGLKLTKILEKYPRSPSAKDVRKHMHTCRNLILDQRASGSNISRNAATFVASAGRQFGVMKTWLKSTSLWDDFVGMETPSERLASPREKKVVAGARSSPKE
jgi:hypothetical protein